MNPQALGAMPAFPTNETMCTTPQPGMDLRTYIAIKVYVALVADDKFGRTYEAVADEAIVRADHLLAALCGHPRRKKTGDSNGA